ncbi:SDR family oxidoreductase [Lacticaseibacillus parakribbianus]|uniref:SDR family oxidoreductase n=1 Tax=Lacticaseibacillus parakribbianus TaxID=2970927 RepID=UPI0021CB75DA|nr:SDR family NAD(P)-dependent oxidoreductase [Lacticaseibacillus parakribbianus]
MKLTQNTILITGGTSGLGLRLAQALLRRGNVVIVTSRRQTVIDQAVAANPGLVGYPVDVADRQSVQALAATIRSQHPDLNMVINSAGIMRGVNFFTPQTPLTAEIETNLIGTANVDWAFLPQLAAAPEAALVNVGSGLGYLPSTAHPLYAASKAGVHALTTALRNQAAYWGYRQLHVIQVAPPLVAATNLEPTMHANGERNPLNMDIDAFVAAVLKGIGQNRAVINPGASRLLAAAGRLAPRWLVARLMRRTMQTEFPQRSGGAKA